MKVGGRPSATRVQSQIANHPKVLYPIAIGSKGMVLSVWAKGLTKEFR